MKWFLKKYTFYTIGFVLVFLISMGEIDAQDVFPIHRYPARKRALVEITLVKRTISHNQPWKDDVFTHEKSTGFYVDDYFIMATHLDVSNAISVTIKNLSDDKKSAADIIAYDSELKVAILRVKNKRIAQDALRGAIRIKILNRPGLLMKLNQIQCLSLDKYKNYTKPVEQSIFLKGVQSHRTPGGRTKIPALLFTSWEHGIKPGDILISENVLIGVVIHFDKRTRYGHAIPGVFLKQFEKEHLPLRKENRQKFIIQKEAKNRPPHRTIVPHPGFEYFSPRATIHKNYFNMGPHNGGVVVTHVHPYSDAFGKLMPDDVILAVDGRMIKREGVLYDPVLGRLPLDAALIIKDGRLRRNHSHVLLRVARKRNIRNVSIILSPLRGDNYKIPPAYKRPEYMIIGGLVLLELSDFYLTETRNKSDRFQYLLKTGRFRRFRNHRKYVVLDKILPITMNSGYDYSNLLILSVNGIAVKNLKHMRFLVKKIGSKNFPVVIKLEGNREIVLNPDRFIEAAGEVRKKYGIQFMNSFLHLKNSSPAK